MNYFSAFEIAASGMDVQRHTLDIVALNLANVNTTRTAEGGVYKPLKVVVGEKINTDFSLLFDSVKRSIGGVEIVDIQQVEGEPNLVFDPSHPDANESGFVAFPDINPVTEMVTLMKSKRAYEANVKVINAARAMTLRALEIGAN